MRLALVRAGVEQVLDLAELAIAADERRLQPGRLQRAAGARDDAERAPERRQADLPLQLVAARVLVGDRLLGRAAGRLADEDGARLGERLDPRRRC